MVAQDTVDEDHPKEEGTMNDMNAREVISMLTTEISSLINGKTEDNREPVLEYLKLCVACVENIALTAAEWGRRFGKRGQSHEEEAALNDGQQDRRADIDEDSDYIVTVCLAALSGQKADLGERESDSGDEEEVEMRDEGSKETKEEKKGKESLAICANAAARIKDIVSGSFGGDAVSPLVMDGFSGNEESLQYVPVLEGDLYDFAYTCQYVRQAIATRIEASLSHSQLGDVEDSSSSTTAKLRRQSGSEVPRGLSRVRKANWLRLSQPRSKMQISGVTWNSTFSTVLAPSDPVNMSVAYAVRQIPRYDMEVEYRLVVTIRLHNITAVSIPNSTRLDLGLVRTSNITEGADSKLRQKVKLSRPSDSNVLSSSLARVVLGTAGAVFKNELRSGDHLTWEVVFEKWSTPGSVALFPSVRFREVEKEPPLQKWIGAQSLPGQGDEEEKSKSENMSTLYSTASLFGYPIGGADEEDETVDMTLSGDAVHLSPMIVLQPCPLVFYRDKRGDISAFNFLWASLPLRGPSMKLKPFLSHQQAPSYGEAARVLAKSSEIDHPDQTQRLWSFMSWCGRRILLRFSHRGGGELLEVRTDEYDLLLSLLNAEDARNTFVSDITSGKYYVDALIDGM
eukprot:CAMPEP_0118682868 /NCGR_PEP_ID=MMETSP0800-20121206/5717_1 /TAXON_ID=210618 ORGANISM="Striatella unipunctata, Strain CCMP2910" /NCGR_SAMPLE_ID=MMETSP0800 /ASSEMBLY_ACC=CAM_ASM_000638 /LENGTH=624 /DNA_ID=CAMNT_0006579291 /DNA_START=407 /DNA_END=2281 /DNA_ORIENTATION=+